MITALCVTRNRPKSLAGAIENFLNQTFKDAELLIVADGDTVFVQHPRIKVVNLISRPATLGEKRNIGCNLADGNIIALWDDDDYHAPNRLINQIVTMRQAVKPVVAYNKMKFTDGHNWWLYDGILPSIGIGGSLCFLKAFWEHNKFPELNEAEDNVLIRTAWNKRMFLATSACGENPIAGVEDFDKMVATVHSGNTSKRDTRPGGNYRLIGQFCGSGSLSERVLAAERPNEQANGLASLESERV